MLQSNSSEKKLVKPQYPQKRSDYGPHQKWKTIFLVTITKAYHQLSETFYFIKISYVLTEL